MSVMDMKNEIEFVCDALCISILGSSRYHHAVCDREAIPDILKATIDYQKDVVHSWCNRLYVANQCAYIFTYAHRAECDRKINFIADVGQCRHGNDLIANIGRFYRTLESIRYNMYSNSGQCMLCREDMDRLNTLIEYIGRDIVWEYQRGKVKA